jgi:integrase
MRRQKRKGGRDTAYVVLSGRYVYLGAWGSLEADEKYKQEIHVWNARGRVPIPPTPPADLTVSEVADAYLVYAEDYFATSPDTSLARVKYAINDLTTLYSRLPIAELSGIHLIALREAMLNRRCKTDPDKPAVGLYVINYRVKTIKAMVTWAVSRGLCPPDVKGRVDAVENLKAGRCAARPPRKVEPVSLKVVNKTKKHLNPTLCALIDLQLITGARPGELVGLRRDDITQVDDTLWEAELTRHKTDYKGKRRLLVFGPQAIQILRPLMLKAKGGYLFPAADSMAARIEAAHSHRRPNQKPNKHKTERKLGPHYTTESYRRAIARACKEAEVDTWHPHQLRHSAATRLRKEADLEAARVILGHGDKDTAANYAERDFDAARDWARKHG